SVREMQARPTRQEMFTNPRHIDIAAILTPQCCGQNVTIKTRFISPTSHLGQEFRPSASRDAISFPACSCVLPTMIKLLRMLTCERKELRHYKRVKSIQKYLQQR